MCRAMNSSSRAKTGCTAPDWANALSGIADLRTLIASADLVLVDKNFRRERFITIFSRKGAKTQRKRLSVFTLRLCAFARENLYSKPRLFDNSTNRGSERRFLNTGSTLMNGNQLKRSCRDFSSQSIAR